jgi:hypothetical protein
MDKIQKKQIKTLNKEFLQVQRKEDRLMKNALKARRPGWKRMLEAKVPEKVYSGLNSAFAKGFSVVFCYGHKVLEKTYKKDTISLRHAVRDEGFQTNGSRKEMKLMHKNARKANSLNITMTTIEGIGLGALGIGMPDIVLFLTTLLKGIYETAIHYGFGYESRQEQYFILKMMSASLQTGQNWVWENKAVDRFLETEEPEISEEAFQEQLRKTASAFAVDMLLLKFIQGMPVVGFLGGAANPVYYNKVMKYVQIKYQKRYLKKQL